MIELNYYLDQEEMKESLLCLNWKKEGIRKIVHIYILCFLGAFVLLLYLKNPAQSLLFMSALMILMLCFAIMYVPGIRRSRQIRKMLRQKGLCHVKLTEKGIAGEKEYLFSAEKPMVLESEHVYTIRLRRTFFCIPKRALPEQEQVMVKQILSHSGCSIRQFKTKVRG